MSSQNIYTKPSSGGVTIGAPISGGNPGSVLFSDVSNNVQDDGAFTYVSNNLSVPGDIKTTSGNVVLKQKTTLVGSAGVFTATFPEKSGTVAMTSDVTGGITIGAAVSGGANNRLLFEDFAGNLQISTNLIYSDTGSGLATTLPIVQTTNALAATTAAGLTLQNTTAATSGVTVQVSPSLYLLGKTWGSSSNITGFRAYSSGVSGGRGAFYPVFNVDSTVDGSTFINVMKLYSVASGQSATLATPLTVSGSITATASNTIAAGGNLQIGNTAGIISSYNAVTTAGNGVPSIYGSGRATGQTAANASVATYTVGASDGSFLISANINVTTSSAESFSATCVYTDETNTVRTQTIGFLLLAGTVTGTIAFANGAVPYEGVVFRIRAKAGTAITIKTGGTFTGCTYNVEGDISQVS